LEIKIPEERIGVLVGPGGSVKNLIEERTKTKMEIDSDSGTVSIISSDDPLLALRALDLIKPLEEDFLPKELFLCWMMTC
jgi:ribosomal RNA assembly protein